MLTGRRDSIIIRVVGREGHARGMNSPYPPSFSTVMTFPLMPFLFHTILLSASPCVIKAGEYTPLPPRLTLSGRNCLLLACLRRVHEACRRAAKRDTPMRNRPCSTSTKRTETAEAGLVVLAGVVPHPAYQPTRKLAAYPVSRLPRAVTETDTVVPRHSYSHTSSAAPAFETRASALVFVGAVDCSYLTDFGHGRSTLAVKVGRRAGAAKGSEGSVILG